MTKAFVIAARRSAVAPRNGHFAELSLDALGGPVIADVLRDAGVAPEEVGEIITANSLGAGGNPARLIALAAGLPEHVGGLSIDRQCVGGLDALLIATAMISSGQHRIVLAGGVESYSRRPLRFRTFADGRAPVEYEQAQFTPWPDRDPDMAEAADALARRLGIDKSAQDDWAIESHAKAMASPVEIQEAEITEIHGLADDAFKRNLGPRHCARAKVVHGSITAANMSVAADGAAFALLVSEDVLREKGCNGVELVGGQTIGGDPELPGLAPVGAIQMALAEADISPQDLVSAEIMEAFAVQAIACQQGAKVPTDIVNQQGGSLARGHPIGASGAILAVRLFHDVRRTGGPGLAAIAAAGGLGTAIVAQAD